MHSFAYKNGTLYCENVNLQELADKESTPLYVYSKQTILNHFHRLREALAPLNAEVAYAVKACSNIAILNLMARNGAGFDIVSGGELFRVLKAGGRSVQMHLCRRRKNRAGNPLCPGPGHLLLQCGIRSGTAGH